MISTALCLTLLHGLFAILVWFCSPYPVLTVPLACAWPVLAALATRTLVAPLGRWQAAGCLVLFLLVPAAAGAWDLLYFAHAAARGEVACTVEQLWMTPLLPLVAFIPGWWWGGTAAYLWVLNALPLLIFAALLALAMTATRRPVAAVSTA